MTFPVEIVLKGRDSAVTTTAVVPGEGGTSWDEATAHAVLVEILRAIDRAGNPDAPAEREVILQGFSWIVEPVDERVVIAIEIPMGAAVAGPFDIDQVELDELVARAISADRKARGGGRGGSTTVH